MKIERLLTMTIMLLNRRRVIAQDLADRFEVSVRTVYRDVETLNASGIPVISFQGQGGGFCIPDHYKLSRQLLTFSDVVSILSTLKGVNHTLQNRDVDRAIEKISALIPPEEAEQYRDHTDGFMVDIRPWGAADALQELLRVVHAGVRECRVLSFSYTPAHGQATQREVEPHTLVFKGFSWYVLAWCRLRLDFRVFRLSRIRDLRMQQGYFSRRKVDPAPYFTPARDSRERVAVVLKFQPGVRVRLEETFGPEKLAYNSDGTILATITVPDDPWLDSFILGFGDQVEVVSPEGLRQRVVKKIIRMKNIYSNLT